MTKVRAHKVRTASGRTVTRRQHVRQNRITGTKHADRWRFRPQRAVVNARRSRRAARRGKRATAALYATAAVSEILGFVVFRGVGGVLVVAGVVFAVVGAFLSARS